MKQIGLIGLGKMGFNLIQNIKRQGYEPIGYDISQEAVDKIAGMNIQTATSIKDLVEKLPKPRYVMLLVPAGMSTHETIEELFTLLEPGDVIIDAGNSFYETSLKHARQSKERGLEFVDVGTSGGTSGALNGACFMVGGSDEVMKELSPFFEKLAVENGFLHTGKPGSGHYAKMVHNGIEYGMMQAIAEGFEIIENSQFNYNKEKLAKVWNHGSVIRSWLIELVEQAYQKDQNLDQITGYVEMNGEGNWTVMEALKQGTPAPVISLSVQMRQRSQQKDTYAGKVLASLRNEFGGHKVILKDEKNK